MSRNLRLAIVGCGAVVEQSHASALRRLNLCPSVLIDPSAGRRRSIAGLFQQPVAEYERIEDATGFFDAALVAAPHAFHAALCSELLAAGKHVLVEKPLAASSEEAGAIIRAAKDAKGRLAVALMRRQTRASRWFKSALQADAFGTLHRFVIREGYEYSWPLTTDSMWRRAQAGGGVLMDTGAHTLDQIVWWFGEPADVEFFDDADGGVEADCLIRMRWDNGLEGEVELSRTRRLSNAVTLTAAKGQVTLACLGSEVSGDAAMLSYRDPEIGGPSFASQSVEQLFQEQWTAFISYVQGHMANVVSGEDAARSIALIEKCYAVRKRLDLPWLSYSTPSETA